MSHRLSDNDRTLLSAYMDGEVSADESRDAEQLLSGSEEARTYLEHLRAVHGFSVQAFPVVPIGATAGITAGKLSAGAISAAAKKSALIKGLTLGPWGTVGVFAAAASVAAGVTVALQSTDAPLRRGPVAVHRAAGPISALPAPVDVDTTSLIVPPMTPNEMVRFAVDGIVPIDSKRNHFLSLAAHGRDSMVVSLHGRTPHDPAYALDEIDPRQWQELDSVHRAIRTALLQYKNGGIAIRCDIPSLRLKALEHLERLCQQLPVKVQEELTSVRREVEASRATIQAEVAKNHRLRAFQGNRVPYVVLSLNNLDRDGEPERIPIPPTPPNPFEQPSGSVQFVVIDGTSLDELGSAAPSVTIEPSQTFSAGGYTTRHIEVRQKASHTFNPTGELPSLQTQMPQPDNAAEYPSEGTNQLILQQGPSTQLMFRNNQVSIHINQDSLIQSIQQALDVADSTLRHLDRQIEWALPKIPVHIQHQQFQSIQSNGTIRSSEWISTKPDSIKRDKNGQPTGSKKSKQDDQPDEGGNE